MAAPDTLKSVQFSEEILEADIDDASDEDNNAVLDAEENPSKESRVFKKAKRFHAPNGYLPVTSSVFVDGSGPSLGNGDGGSSLSSAKISVAVSKNSKKSRSGRRGQPKKGGAGGKGTWGKPGSELDAELDAEDENDPNYDSDSLVEIKLPNVVAPTMTEEQFDDALVDLLKEFFEHGQVQDIIAQIVDLDAKVALRVRLPLSAISLAVQRKPRHCELTSQLLAELCGKAISDSDLSKGFDIVLRDLTDMTIDSPEAPDIVGRFIARAVADDILPPKFVHNYKGMLDSPEAVKALAKAENLLTMAHSYTRLDNVWGVSGGMKPTKLLVKKMKLLLEEFLSSKDSYEAQHCLKELDAPHFHHELVYQAMMMVIEKSTGNVCNLISDLFTCLCKSVVLTVDQLTMGVQRIYRDMPDIYLDVPNAYALLERFIENAHKAKYLPLKLYRDMPQKGRKRFVSEGDGGKEKQASAPILL